MSSNRRIERDGANIPAGSSRIERRGEVGSKIDAGNDATRAAFRVTISTDAAIPSQRHANGAEILSHADGAIDLSRANKGSGLPALVGHDARGLPVGRVTDLEVSDGKLAGILRVARSQAGIVSDIEDGVITDVSVGAIVRDDDWSEDGDGVFVANRWTPIEASLVSFGADPGAGVHRSADGGNTAPSESDRKDAIVRLFTGLDDPKYLRMQVSALSTNDSVELVRSQLDAELKKDAIAFHQVPDVARVQAGPDSIDKWCSGVERALDYRTGMMGAEDRIQYERSEIGQSEFVGMTLYELARDFLRARGMPARGDRNQIVVRALSVPAVTRAMFSHTTSDFSNLLAGTSDKSLAKGFTEAPESYGRWSSNVTLSNFRAASFASLSTFGDLDEIPENGEFEYGSFSDKAETLQLREYGKLFSIGRTAILNDDLGSFTRIPGHMGRAAARKVGDLAYAVLTSNPTMTETARALFNTTDTSLAASGGAISTTTLDAGNVAMGKYTDPAGNTLNVEPRYLLVPKAIETAARVQIASEKDPGEGATTSFDKPNPFRNRLEVISDARLDAASATAWYLIASQNAGVESVAIGWLNNVMRPRLEQQAGFEVEGIAYRVAIDCTAGALDWRGSYKNAGA